MMLAYLCLGMLIGFLLGLLFSVIVWGKRPCGTIKFRKDEDGEYMYVELKHGLQDIHGEKTVKFNVDEYSHN